MIQEQAGKAYKGAISFRISAEPNTLLQKRQQSNSTEGCRQNNWCVGALLPSLKEAGRDSAFGDWPRIRATGLGHGKEGRWPPGPPRTDEGPRVNSMSAA